MKKETTSKKKQTKNTKSKKNNKAKKNSNRINLSNEIFIGLTPKQDEKTKKKPSKKINKKGTIKKKTNKPEKKVKDKKIKTKAKKNKTNTRRPKIDFENRELNKVKVNIAKWTGILILALILLIILLRSSLFNIKEIVVENNNKLTSDEIISLSGIQKETNMFEYSSKIINKKLSENPYIESASIKRNLNGTLTININERRPTYMLKFANAFVYINNQGYMLEITETPIEVPLITGFETSIDDIKEGNRLCTNDLIKLDDVIKIMNSANETLLAKIITGIDIGNSNNYILSIDSERKKVQFGGTTNINVKLLKIQEVLENEKEVAGEIYFQDAERTIFKEDVNI